MPIVGARNCMVRITTIAINTMISAVREINYLRMRWVGHCLHLEARITADPEVEFSQLNNLRKRIDQELLNEVPYLEEITESITPYHP